VKDTDGRSRGKIRVRHPAINTGIGGLRTVLPSVSRRSKILGGRDGRVTNPEGALIHLFRERDDSFPVIPERT
jgi:hypothetical protein